MAVYEFLTEKREGGAESSAAAIVRQSRPKNTIDEAAHSSGTLTLGRPVAVATIADDDGDPIAPAGRVALASAPKLRAVYRCRFWRDAHRPEFYKNRPVAIVSRDNRLDGPALIVPMTTKAQSGNKLAYKLTGNPNPRRPGIERWAICNHIYTVSCARLAHMDGGVPGMKPQDFDEIVRLVLRALPDAPAERIGLPSL